MDDLQQSDKRFIEAAEREGLITSDAAMRAREFCVALMNSAANERIWSVLVRTGVLTLEQAQRVLESVGVGLEMIPGYQILGLIGQGGMGTVYKAKQTRMDRIVALKVLRRDLLCDGDLVDRFLRETRMAARIIHPNVVTAFDAGDSPGGCYYAMEYVPGRTVRELIEARLLDERKSLAIFRQILFALQALHEGGLVHRDIKPENILVSDRGAAKLCDLGLSRPRTRAEQGLTRSGTSVGTPGYISPEQIEGRDSIDIRSDLYSLGGTLYCMLTGRPPYAGSTAEATMAAHLSQPVPDPRHLTPQIGARTAAIVRRCLAKDPKDRFQSPAHAIAALDAAPRKTQQPSPPPPPRAGIRRAVIPAGAAAAGLLALVIGLVVSAGPQEPARIPGREVPESSAAPQQTAPAAVRPPPAPNVVEESPQPAPSAPPEAPPKADPLAPLRASIAAGRWEEASGALAAIAEPWPDPASSRAGFQRQIRDELEAESALARAREEAAGLEWDRLEASIHRIRSDLSATRTIRERGDEVQALTESLARARARSADDDARLGPPRQALKDQGPTHDAPGQTEPGQAEAGRFREGLCTCLLCRGGLGLEFGDAAYAESRWQDAARTYRSVLDRHSNVPAVAARREELRARIERAEAEIAARMEKQASVHFAVAGVHYGRSNWDEAARRYRKLRDEFADTEFVRRNLETISTRLATAETRIAERK